MSSTVEFVESVEGRLRPLELELAEAWWQSNTESSPEADGRRIDAELARSALLADAELFAEIRAARDSTEAGADPHLFSDGSTSSTTPSCPSRCRPNSGAPSSSSRRAWNPPSTISGVRSTVAGSTTT